MSANNTSSHVNNSIGPTLLGITFVVLKLCGVINWSWWLVTLPFWAGAVFVLAFLFVALVLIPAIILIAYAMSKGAAWLYRKFRK